MVHADPAVAPVEYAVAVDRYLAEAELGAASRRVYRISLTSWAWPLVGKLPPAGRDRRLASPPVVPLALLDQSGTSGRLAIAVQHRIRIAQARTVNRELSALRSAVGWWQARSWIDSDPTAGLHQVAGRPVAQPPLTSTERSALFQAPVGLREQALWHLLQDTGATAETVLRLDASGVDIAGRQARLPAGGLLRYPPGTAELLDWLLAGRRTGPVFRTDRRAPAGTHRPGPDVLPARRRDLQRMDPAARPGRARLDAASAAPAASDAGGSRACYNPESAASSNAVNGVGPTSPTVICASAGASRSMAARNSSA